LNAISFLPSLPERGEKSEKGSRRNEVEECRAEQDFDLAQNGKGRMLEGGEEERDLLLPLVFSELLSDSRGDRRKKGKEKGRG